MQRDGEASVEEILESIKKVIARDNRDSAQNARRQQKAGETQPEASVASSADEDEILELGEAAEIVSSDTEAELISEDVRSAMAENFAALSMLSEPPAKPQIVRSGETSLEGMARELLRPMLAEWLDKNLPAIVEAMVAREIARIAGKQR